MGKVEPVNDEQRAVRPGVQVPYPERVAGRHHRGQQLATLIVKDKRRNVTCARVMSEGTLISLWQGRFMHVRT